MFLDVLNYAPLLLNETGGTVITSIRTILTVAYFIFNLSSFQVAIDLVTSINVFVYFPECAWRARVKSFFQQYIQLCCVLKAER